MGTSTVVEALRELLAEEQCSLPARFLESTVFVSQSQVEDLAAVDRMVRNGREHGAWLSELISQLGGSPGPRRTNPASADLHYQELRPVLPRLVEDRESLVHVYEAAMALVSSEPTATELVGRILARHQEELEKVRGIVRGQSAAAG